MDHPFADRIGLVVAEQSAGHSRCTLTLDPAHLNPHGVVHGAVVFALADTGMGSRCIRRSPSASRARRSR